MCQGLSRLSQSFHRQACTHYVMLTVCCTRTLCICVRGERCNCVWACHAHLVASIACADVLPPLACCDVRACARRDVFMLCARSHSCPWILPPTRCVGMDDSLPRMIPLFFFTQLAPLCSLRRPPPGGSSPSRKAVCIQTVTIVLAV